MEPSPHTMSLAPHRGTLILVLGILSLLMCQPLGIVAWVLANGDLRDMDEGRMDPTGRSNTEVGRILGMIAFILLGLGAAVGVLAMLFYLVTLGTFAGT